MSEQCMEFAGARLNGYGWTRYQGRGMGAHRAAYIAEHGPIPPGLVVMHLCDNPPCVNLDHLRLGTQSENIRDCFRKGRMANRPGPTGEQNRNAKLSADQVREIRRLAADGQPHKVTAAQFGVSHLTAWEIATRRSWKSLA